VQIGTGLTHDREDRDISRLGVTFELLRETDAVDSIGAHVEDNQVRAMRLDRRERLLCGGGAGNTAVLHAQTSLNESQHVIAAGDKDPTVADASLSRAEPGCALTGLFMGTGGGGTVCMGEHDANEEPPWTVASAGSVFRSRRTDEVARIARSRAPHVANRSSGQCVCWNAPVSLARERCRNLQAAPEQASTTGQRQNKGGWSRIPVLVGTDAASPRAR
jgi:hypothetical protein